MFAEPTIVQDGGQWVVRFGPNHAKVAGVYATEAAAKARLATVAAALKKDAPAEPPKPEPEAKPAPKPVRK